MADLRMPLVALEFLTVVRLRRWSPLSETTLARAQAFYPLVGLLLGGVLVLADLALAEVLPAGPRSALLLALLAALTRGLHLDGLADMVDGLLGGRTPERRLEIMRDPRIGSFGATALIVVLLTQWSCLVALTGDLRRPGLLIVPVLGRFAMVLAVAAVPYARPEGLGVRYREAALGWPLAAATTTVLAACGVLFGWTGFALLAVVILCFGGVAYWSWRSVGGATGDVFGGACVLAETGALLTLVAGMRTGVPALGGWW